MRMVSAHQAAEILGVRRRTIYSLTSQRKIPFYKRGGKGGRVQFDADELERIAKGRRVEPVSA